MTPPDSTPPADKASPAEGSVTRRTDPALETSAGPRIRPGTVVPAVLILGALLMWIVAFTGFGKSESPDLLHDKDWATAANDVCEAAQDDLAQVPNADKADSPQGRSAILNQGDQILADMIDDLAQIPTRDERDASTVDKWLEDYRTHLGDRERYSAQLADGEDVPFTETARENKGISKVIDKFAETNSMAACATPDDA